MRFLLALLLARAGADCGPCAPLGGADVSGAAGEPLAPPDCCPCAPLAGADARAGADASRADGGPLVRADASRADGEPLARAAADCGPCAPLGGADARAGADVSRADGFAPPDGNRGDCHLLALRDFYQAEPYPPRDPAAETPGRARHGTHDDPVAAAYVAGVPLPAPGDRYDVLVAGGGTGDATVQLALLLAPLPGASVLHVDLSAASIAVARARLARHAPDVARVVRFWQGSYTDPDLNDGLQFDYINCVGVLHHHPDPPAALRALAARLKPGRGVLQLGVYSALGRRGVYDVRELLALLGVADADGARAVLGSLPPSNWLRRNAAIWGSEDLKSSAGILDLLLNPCDVAYDVPGLLALVRQAGLRVQDGVSPSGFADWPRQARLEELRTGGPLMHAVWLVRADHPQPPPAQRGRPRAADVLCAPDALQGRELPGAREARHTLHSSVEWRLGEAPPLRGLPALAPLLVSLADCRRSLAEAHALVAQQVEYELTLEELLGQAQRLLEADTAGLVSLVAGGGGGPAGEGWAGGERELRWGVPWGT